MLGWSIKGSSGNYSLKIYVLDQDGSMWHVCSELAQHWKRIRISNKTGREYIDWSGVKLYLDEAVEIGEPRNKVRIYVNERNGRSVCDGRKIN